MNFLIKAYNHFNIKYGYLLISQNNPFLINMGIQMIVQSHVYIDKDNIAYQDISELLTGCNKVNITGTGVLLIFYDDKIVKFPLGRDAQIALQTEYSNYLVLKKNALKELVNYSLEKKENYYIMEKLFPLNNEYYGYKKVISILNRCQHKERNLSTYCFRKEFKNAFFSIQNRCKSCNIEYLMMLIDKKMLLSRMAMHGDLTPQNIMKNSMGETVMIDLDRFKIDGFNEIDRIHYIIEHYVKRKQKNFFDLLIYILKNKNISTHTYYLLLFYFLYRIDVEYSETTTLTTYYYNKLCQTCSLFELKSKEV